MASPVMAILQSAADAIGEVDDAGVVHPRLTQVRDFKEFLEKLVSENGAGDDRVQGWILEPSNPVVSSAIVGLGENPEIEHTLGIRITGFSAVRETEEEGETPATFSHDDFLAVAWSVKLALDGMDIDLDGVEGSDHWTRLPTLCQWRSFEMRLFGGTACWVATMTLPVNYTAPAFAIGG